MVDNLLKNGVAADDLNIQKATLKSMIRKMKDKIETKTFRFSIVQTSQPKIVKWLSRPSVLVDVEAIEVREKNITLRISAPGQE